MKGKFIIYLVIAVFLLQIPYIASTGAHNFTPSPESAYAIQDNAGLLSASVQHEIASINDYLKNNNSANIVILTFNEDIKGDKEYFINNYKRTWNIDKDNNVFIIAIFPKEIVISIDKGIRPYFSDLLLEGFQRKIIEGKQEGNLEDVLLEITQKVHGKLREHGWIDVQIFKVKDFVDDYLVKFGIGTDTKNQWIYEVKYSINKVERALSVE